MGLRRKAGRLHVVSAPMVQGEGRPSNAASALPARRRPPLVGVDGHIASLVLAHESNAIAIAQGDEARRKASGMQVRKARARLVRELGIEDEQRIERVIQAGRRLPLRALASLPGDAREWLVDAAIESCHLAHEHAVDSHGAVVAIAMALRLRAIGQCMLNQGAASSDADVLSAAAKLIGQARLELLAALEQARQAREVAEKAAQAKRFAGWAQRPATPAAEHED